MRYMLLIHQGTAPTPRSPEEWSKVPEDEQQAVFADYQAINETPGVSPGLQLEPPETATTVRVEDGNTLTTDGPFVAVKEALGGTCCSKPTISTPRSRLRREFQRPHGRCGRGAPDHRVVDLLEQTFREEWSRPRQPDRLPRRLRARRGGRQEAFAIAAGRWPRDGAPSDPRAWLTTTARNRAIDRIRRDRMRAAKTRLLDAPEAIEDDVLESEIPDERLELIFTCCHPALALDAQVALTLRTLGGLSTEEIARAFLVPGRPWPSGS